MARWRELPDTLDQRAAQLVVQLRRLKDRSGLSLASLAAKTEYSRSSWERYLNGKALPPRAAVEKLARVTGADPTRLLVLHELAEEAWPRRAAAQDEAEPAAGPAAPDPAGDRPPDGEGGGGAVPPPVAGVRKGLVVVAVAVAALAGAAAGYLAATPWNDGDGDRSGTVAAAQAGAGTKAPTAAAGPGRYVFKPGRTYACRVRRAADGRLGAGYSPTRTAVLAGPGWDVVEAQCLLAYRKLGPGTVDGVYGHETINAVMRLQKAAGLPADGVVGPHTWQALRG